MRSHRLADRVGRGWPRKAHLGSWLLLALLGLVLAGCGPFVDDFNLQDGTVRPVGPLAGGEAVAQAFVAHCDYLSAVEVQAAIYPTIPRGTGSLMLALATAVPGAGARPVARTSLPLAAVAANQWVQLAVPPIAHSAGTTFLVEVQTNQPGPSGVSLWSVPGTTGAAGGLQRGAQPLAGTLTYRVWCDPPPLVLAGQTLASAERLGGLWPTVALLLLLPGLALEAWLEPDEPDLAARLGAAAGWSVLLAPLALVALGPLHHIGLTAGAFLGASIAGLLAAAIYRFALRPGGPHPAAEPGMGPGEGEPASRQPSKDGFSVAVRPGRDPTSHPTSFDRTPDRAADSAEPPHSSPAPTGVTVGGSLTRQPAEAVPVGAPRPARPPRGNTITLALAVGATLVSLGVHAIHARDLAVPLWVDSIQHAYVVQRILATGAVPNTYGPLVAPQVFDYHFGFQTLAAFAAVLAVASAPVATLVVGQALGATMVLASYRFARDLTERPVGGAVAAVLVGMITTQPTYYVTWGRYPELAGLVALPAATAAVLAAIRLKSTWFARVAAVVAAGALVLVHPRIAVFLASLLLATILVHGALRSRREASQQFLRLVSVAGASLLLISPWVWRLWQAHHQQTMLRAPWQPIDFPWGLATAGDDRWLLALAGLALVLGLGQRSAVAGICLGWSVFVVVLANPTTFHLPISLWLDDNSVAIAVFLPAVVLVGDLVASATALTPPAWRQYPIGALAGGLVFLAAASQTPYLVRVVNPCCELLRPEDLTALAWVRTHTPPDAQFIINGVDWQDPVWAGTDAGYWLPVLAGRRTDLPPLFYAVGPPDQARRTEVLAATVNRDAADPATLAALARRIGAWYVFVGARGGALDPVRLADSGQFRVLYQDAGDWVLEVAGVGGGTVGQGSDGTPGSGSGGDSTVVVIGVPPTDMRSTSTGITPVVVGTPSDEKAAGLRSTTSG